METSIREANRKNWFDRIERYLAKEISQSLFCQEENLNKGTFTYWLKKYRKKEDIEKTEIGFVSLTEFASRGISEEILVRVGHVEISIPATLSLESLIPFVKALS